MNLINVSFPFYEKTFRRLEDDLSDEKLENILDEIELKTVEDDEKRIANKYYKIANILGLKPNASPEQKQELVTKIEKLAIQI